MRHCSAWFRRWTSDVLFVHQTTQTVSSLCTHVGPHFTVTVRQTPPVNVTLNVKQIIRYSSELKPTFFDFLLLSTQLLKQSISDICLHVRLNFAVEEK